MERDFMGLSLNSVVKEEPVEICKDSGFGCSLSNKVDVPHFVSLNSAEPWFNSNGSAATTQLTIFYGATVSVFEDISPEKAQAIMFLAGNGCTPNLMKPRFQVQSSAPKVAATDDTVVNQSPNVLGLSSPVSVSSHPIGQSGGSSANEDGVKMSKTANISLAPHGSSETPKILTSVRANAIMPAAVPQSRKASLARFLERRKERAMNAAPYGLNKKMGECSTPESATSSVDTSPLIAG